MVRSPQRHVLFLALVLGAVMSVGCGTAWKVIRDGGSPSPLKGAGPITVSFDYSKLVVGGKTEQAFVEEKKMKEPGYDKTWSDSKSSFETNFVTGLAGGYTAGVQAGAPGQGAHVVVFPTLLTMGKYMVVTSTATGSMPTWRSPSTASRPTRSPSAARNRRRWSARRCSSTCPASPGTWQGVGQVPRVQEQVGASRLGPPPVERHRRRVPARQGARFSQPVKSARHPGGIGGSPTPEVACQARRTGSMSIGSAQNSATVRSWPVMSSSTVRRGSTTSWPAGASPLAPRRGTGPGRGHPRRRRGSPGKKAPARCRRTARRRRAAPRRPSGRPRSFRRA